MISNLPEIFFERLATQCLINIREIPIFSYFDIYKPYNNENIEELTYYIIEVEEYSNELSIMFKEKISRVFGYILKSINFKYKILYFSKPYYIRF